jgi:hypothetical protein
MTNKRSGKKGTAKKRAGKQTSKRPKRVKKASSAGKPGRPRSKRGPVNSIRKAGEKTWKALKSKTAHVMEGVKDRFSAEENTTDR